MSRAGKGDTLQARGQPWPSALSLPTMHSKLHRVAHHPHRVDVSHCNRELEEYSQKFLGGVLGHHLVPVRNHKNNLLPCKNYRPFKARRIHGGGDDGMRTRVNNSDMVWFNTVRFSPRLLLTRATELRIFPLPVFIWREPSPRMIILEVRLCINGTLRDSDKGQKETTCKRNKMCPLRRRTRSFSLE